MAGQESQYNQLLRERTRFTSAFPSAAENSAQARSAVLQTSTSPVALALAMRRDVHNQADTMRLQRYFENWRFYLGDHYTQGKPEDGITRITHNYVKAFVNKLNRFLNHDGFNVILPQQYDKLAVQINKIFKINNHKSLAMNIGLNGCVTGDGWVRVNFKNQDGKKEITFSVIDSSLVFPLFDEFLNLKRVEIRHPIPNESGGIVPTGYISEVHERGIPDVVFMRKRFATDMMTTVDETLTQFNYVNPIPDSLLVFHVSNYEVSNAFWGMDDVSDLKELNKERNKLASSMSEIIEYMEQPITVVKGAKLNNIEKSSRKVWSGIPKDGSVDVLNMNTDLPATQAYMETTIQTMHDISGVPAHSLGKKQEISNTSGIALHYQNMPLMEVRADKIKNYGRLYKEMTITIIRLLKWMGVLAQPIDERFLTSLMEIPLGDEETDNPVQEMDVVFPNPLPRDEILLINQIKALYELELSSQDDAFRMLNYSPQRVARIKKEIEEEGTPIPHGGFIPSGIEPAVQAASQGMLGGAGQGAQGDQAKGGAIGGKMNKAGDSAPAPAGQGA